MPDQRLDRNPAVQIDGRNTRVSIPVGSAAELAAAAGDGDEVIPVDPNDYGPVQWLDKLTLNYVDHAVYEHFEDDGSLQEGLKESVISPLTFHGRLGIGDAARLPESVTFRLEWSGTSGVTTFPDTTVSRTNLYYNSLHYANNDGPMIILSPNGEFSLIFIFDAMEIFNVGGDPEFYLFYNDWVAGQQAPGVMSVSLVVDGVELFNSAGDKTTYTFSRIPAGGGGT